MKFIKIHRFTDFYYSLPEDKKAAIMAGNMAFAEKYMKAGKLKEYYTMSDVKGGIAIWEVESNEELIRLAMEYPGTAYTHFETYPVVDYATLMKVSKDLAASKKPGK
jgi:hypothetical protein